MVHDINGIGPLVFPVKDHYDILRFIKKYTTDTLLKPHGKFYYFKVQ